MITAIVHVGEILPFHDRLLAQDVLALADDLTLHIAGVLNICPDDIFVACDITRDSHHIVASDRDSVIAAINSFPWDMVKRNFTRLRG